MAKQYLDSTAWVGATKLYVDPTEWGDALQLKSASDTLVPAIVETSAVFTITSKSASDTLVAVVADTAQPIVPFAPIVSTKLYVDPTEWTGATKRYGDALAWTSAVFALSSSDSLNVSIVENRNLSNVGITQISASDTLVVAIVEAPIAAWLISTDDSIVVGAGETATSPGNTLIQKTASDILTASIVESSSVTSIGTIVVSASDTLLVSIVDTSSKTVLQSLSASDVLQPSIVETTSLFTPIVKYATDNLLINLVDTKGQFLTIDVPTIGILPPGWFEQELEELTGIERPKRYEPGNVQPIKGWFRRKYWAVYDETGRVRATDRWRSVARAQAWTAYQSGKQSVAA